ncbi:MAG: hypothetical protein LQ351_004391 [Letrouitia transgressa]|nr:MAG: hypothetical protein LQ351_004391 [Letrouitia transgressa]
MSQVAAKKIMCDAIVSPDATEYWGKLSISKIRYEDDSPVTIQKVLGVVFKSPKSDRDVTLDLEPWFDMTPTINFDTLDEKTIAVRAALSYAQSHTFDTEEKLVFEITGNLTDRPDFYTSSVELFAEELPSSIVKITCPAAPDAALASSKQIVHLKPSGQAIDLIISLGAVTQFKVPCGTYTVTADELTTLDQTVVATAQASPEAIVVELDRPTDITLTYDTVDKYAALDITIGALSPPVDKEEFHVKVVEGSTNKVLAEFFSASNHTNKVRRLPSSGTVDVNTQIIVNNIKYSASKSQDLSNNLIQVSVAQADITEEKVDSSSFVSLPVEVDAAVESDQAVSVHLRSIDKDVVYIQAIKAQTGTQTFTVPVAPAKYTVQATSIIDKGTVYAAKVDATLEVKNDGNTKLQLKTQEGANLKVHGFPDFLSFGGLSDLADLSGGAFVAARASSVFKYAGNDGAGDHDKYLTDDPATTKTIQLANSIESQLEDSQQVLPIMISYTCNFSGGDIETHLQDEQSLTHSFANLILSLKLAKEHGKQDVPAGYIVNPDFLGECQKKPLDIGYEMSVRKPLETALEHWEVQATIPASITDTIRGYVLAVNWLFRTVAKEATFGWQVNLWGVGSAAWVYSTDPSKDGPVEVAQKTADYIKSLEVYSGEYSPDFLAIDRYEGDDFTKRAYASGFCFGPYEWGRFFDFCSELSLDLQVPVAPWQIPASRIPLVSEEVNNPETEQWGTGGSYILGDRGVSFDYHNINPTILAIKPNPITEAKTVEDIFIRSQPFDLTYPKYRDFLYRGIFTVLLGGGSTTGIVDGIGTTSSWTQDRLNTYMNSPITISNAESRHK